MLKIVRIIIALIVLTLASYGLITGNRFFMPYMFIGLGLLAFTMSIEELHKQKKATGTLFFLTGTLTLFLAISDLLR